MKTFDDIFVDKTKDGVKVQTSEYGEQGVHIIIDQGQNQIAGYTNREDGLFEEIPVVIFGDHGQNLYKFYQELLIKFCNCLRCERCWVPKI